MDGEFITTLPPNVGRVLTGFVEQARSAFANDLRAVVLYGSGAEGKLRATSDVNLLLVLSAFDQKKANQLRDRMEAHLSGTAFQINNWSGWMPVHQLLRRYPVLAVIAGHFHYDQEEGELDHIRYVVVGSTGGIVKMPVAMRGTSNTLR